MKPIKTTKKNISQGTALITGGSQRLGREMAISLAEKKYNVVIHYNNSKKLASDLAKFLQEKYLVQTAIIKGDLNKAESAKNIADFMSKNFQDWNILINNASIFNKSNFLENIDDELLPNLNIHVISPIYLSHFFAQKIAKEKTKDANIINMIDKNIARYETIHFYYLLSKKFLAEITKMLSLELAPNIRVNGIAPGYILPDKSQKNNAKKNIELYQKLIPVKHIGNTKNIIQALDFILKNDFLTGQILSIDGGASLNHVG